MANTSISGLVSGLDTQTIISQLMQIEAQPQTNLKNQVSAAQKVVTALQGVNTKLVSLFAKAGDLAKPATWAAVTATSDNSGVSVTASGSAGPAQLALKISQTVVPETLDFGQVKLTDQVATDGSKAFTITKPDGSTAKITASDGTVQGLANAINGGNFGLSASLVQEQPGSYHLVVAAQGTGGTAMAITADSGASIVAPVASTTGQQASITVNGTVITSDSNTFKDLMPGVDVTLAAGATGSATVTVAHDEKSLSDSVKSMVDSVNSILTDIDTDTAYDASTKKGGVLSGDSTIRDLRSRILAVVSSGVATSGSTLSMASVGIQTNRDGKLVFDAAKFASAYAADPSGTQAMFAGGSVTDPATKKPLTVSSGFANLISSVADAASNSTSGSVTLAIQGRNSSIKTMNDSIAGWDVRLQNKQDALQRQYAALEVALGKLQDQSTWLAGQIQSLPTMSSKS